MFDEFPGIFGKSFMDPAEREALLNALPETGRMLEIGTAAGATARWLAQRKPGVQILGVDNFSKPHSMNGSLAVQNSRACANYHVFAGTVQEFAILMQWPGFDVILVDAGHLYEEVLADLETAAGLLTVDTGVLLAHDYSPGWPGVKRAIEEFSATQKRFVQILAGSLVKIGPSRL